MPKVVSKVEPARALQVTRRYPDLWSNFRSEMDHLFNNFFGEDLLTGWPRSELPRLATTNSDFVVPDIDVKETNKDIMVSAELPGLGESDIDVTISDGILTLSGEKKYEKTEEKGDYHVMERRFGSFRRSFRLPDSADTEKVEANFDKGVLTVSIPKKKEVVKAEKKIKIGKKAAQ